MENAADIIAILRRGLEAVEAAWVHHQSDPQDDDYDEGLEAGLAEAKEIARAALKDARENGMQ